MIRNFLSCAVLMAVAGESSSAGGSADVQRVGEELAQGIKDQSSGEVFGAAIDSMISDVDPRDAVEVAASILGESPEQVAEEANALMVADTSPEDLDDEDEDFAED